MCVDKSTQVEYDMNSDRVNDKSINSDLYHAVFPIYYLSKLFGVFPMNFVGQVSDRYQGRLSVINSIYSVCLLICLISIEIWDFSCDLSYGREHSIRLKSQNAVISMVGDVVGLISLTASSIINSIVHWKHVTSIIDKLVDYDEKLGIVPPKKIRRYTIFLTLCSLLCCIIVSYLDVYSRIDKAKLNKKRNNSPINYVPLYFMYMIIVMMEIQYFIVTYDVYQRFCRLNMNLENIFKSSRIADQFRKNLGLVDDFRDQRQLPTSIRQDIRTVRMFRRSKIMDSSITNGDKSFTDIISQLMTMHASLCDIVMLINAAYGVVLLMVTIDCLIHLVITLYFLIMEANGESEPLSFLVLGLWYIFHSWRLFMIVEPTHAATTQGKKTAVLVSQLLSISSDEKSRKQLEIFLLQLLHSPLEFSVCGLFTLNRTLVTSIASAVTMFLVILIQFRKGDW